MSTVTYTRVGLAAGQRQTAGHFLPPGPMHTKETGSSLKCWLEVEIMNQSTLSLTVVELLFFQCDTVFVLYKILL